MKLPSKLGRKDLGLGPIFSIQLTLEQHTWIESRVAADVTRSRVIRALVQRAMKATKKR